MITKVKINDRTDTTLITMWIEHDQSIPDSEAIEYAYKQYYGTVNPLGKKTVSNIPSKPNSFISASTVTNSSSKPIANDDGYDPIPF